MRLLITTDTIGGVWTFTQELSVGLLERGCAVLLVSLGRAPSPDQLAWAEERSAESGERFRFVATEFPLEWMDCNDAALAAKPVLRALAAEFGAQLVHSNQFCFGASFFPDLSLPVVVTAHSDVLSWGRSCRPAPLEDSAWLRRYRSLVQSGLRDAAAVTAPTRSMLEALRDEFALPATDVVIPNGRTLQSSAPGAQRRLQSVTAGRLWDEGKNIRMLAAVPTPAMPMLVAGEMEYAGSHMDAQLGAATLLGPRTKRELLALFEQSAIYTCTSRYEPFGLAPLEAALCGCAVLAHDIPTLREVWQDAARYFRSADELGALLRELAEYPDRLAKQQQRSYAHARSYTAARMVDAYLALFQSVLMQAGTAQGVGEASLRAESNVA